MKHNCVEVGKVLKGLDARVCGWSELYYLHGLVTFVGGWVKSTTATTCTIKWREVYDQVSDITVQ